MKTLLNTFILAVFLIPLLMTLGAISAFASTCAIYHPSGNDEYSFGLTSAPAVAQSFTVSAPCTVGAIGSSLETQGSPTATPIISIETDSGGTPSGGILESENVTTSLNSGWTWATTTFSGSTTLSSGTTYWLVWTASSNTTSDGFLAQANTGGSGNAYYYTLTWHSGGEGMLYEIDSAPGGGGGGGNTSNATSTLDQGEENLFNAYIVFYVAFFGMVWLMRKH